MSIYSDTPDQVRALGAQCDRCPLNNCGRGPLLGTLRTNSRLTIIGNHPDDEEVFQAENLIGRSGRFIDAALVNGGLAPGRTTRLNALACQPPVEGAEATLAAAKTRWREAVAYAKVAGLQPPPEPLNPYEACRPRLAKEIELAGSLTTLAIGKKAYESVAKVFGLRIKGGSADATGTVVGSLQHQHGAPITLKDGRILMASFQPMMSILDKKEWTDVIINDISRAAAIAASEDPGLYLAQNWTEPEFQWISQSTYAAIATIDWFRNTAISTGEPIFLDIETNGRDTQTVEVRCIGLGILANDKENIVSIPLLRVADHALWWGDQQELVYTALRRLLDDPQVKIGGQFLDYDTKVLINRGLLTNTDKTWVDTLLLHKNTWDNDLPHNLGFMARRFFLLRQWKTDIADKAGVEMTDYEYGLYNWRDVLVTLRLAYKIAKHTQECGGWQSYETDTKIARIFRNAGLQGLQIDEIARGEQSVRINNQIVKCHKEMTALLDAAGISKPHQFNPSSVPQLQDLLYGRWQLRPMLNVDEEDDDFDQDVVDAEQQAFEESLRGSTSSGTITAILNNPATTPLQRKWLETLNQWRKWKKLAGTYFDNLKVHDELDAEDVGEAPEIKVPRWNNVTYEFEVVNLFPRRAARSVLHPTYFQNIPTGRLSTRPAIQNWPSLGKANARQLIVAPFGHLFVRADFNQVEARIYAIKANDQVLLHAIQEKMDLHVLNAAALLAKHPSQLYDKYKEIKGWAISDPDRYEYWRLVAKRFAFLEIYGGGVDMLYEVMAAERSRKTGELSFPGLKKSQVIIWDNNWHVNHPETRIWHAEVHRRIANLGYAEASFYDFRRRWFLYGLTKKNAGPNMEIQGTASALMNRATILFDEILPYKRTTEHEGIVIQCHDELVGVVVEKDATEMCRALERCMLVRDPSGVLFDGSAKAVNNYGVK